MNAVRSPFTRFFLFAVLVMLAAAVAPASAQPILAEDFESYAVGTSFPCCYPGTTNPGSWELVYSGRYPWWLNQVVVADPAHPGERSLQLWGQPGWSAVIQHRFASASPMLAWRFRIFIEALGGPYADHPSFYRLQGEYPPYDPWGTYYGLVYFDHRQFLPTTPSGSGEIWSEGYASFLGTWQPGHWIEVLVVLDREPTSPRFRTYSVWIDGALAAADLPLAKVCRYAWPDWICDGDKHPERIDSVALVSAHAGVRVFYDDVEVFAPDGPFWIGLAQERIAELNATGSLNQGQANALLQKLEHALARLAAGQPWVAENLLQAFTDQVEDLVAEGVLTSAEGDSLMLLAERARDLLS